MSLWTLSVNLTNRIKGKEMKNILVNRELFLVYKNAFETLDNLIPVIPLDEELRQKMIRQHSEIKTMPSFAESEEDVVVVAQAMDKYPDKYSPPTTIQRAQAAINALKYRKEGGE